VHKELTVVHSKQSLVRGNQTHNDDRIIALFD